MASVAAARAHQCPMAACEDQRTSRNRCQRSGVDRPPCNKVCAGAWLGTSTSTCRHSGTCPLSMRGVTTGDVDHVRTVHQQAKRKGAPPGAPIRIDLQTTPNPWRKPRPSGTRTRSRRRSRRRPPKHRGQARSRTPRLPRSRPRCRPRAVTWLQDCYERPARAASIRSSRSSICRSSSAAEVAVSDGF